MLTISALQTGTSSSGSGFVILLNNAYTETADSLLEDIPTLKTPFRLAGDQLSVMFRVRVHKKTATDSYNLLQLKGYGFRLILKVKKCRQED